jgi:hypothetical protein
MFSTYYIAVLITEWLQLDYKLSNVRLSYSRYPVLDVLLGVRTRQTAQSIKAHTMDRSSTKQGMHISNLLCHILEFKMNIEC